ncbi:MAG: folate-binding protein YgfZ [Rhodobacteraceae bacterium]|nr:folate-binding protein YgfZ [Paracoccaceae bacterium]
MTKGFHDKSRQVLRIGGADRVKFLQDLVTNDVSGLKNGPVYAALLSPKGKYLFDFFLIADGDDILLDVDMARAQALAQRLMMYRLRADVTIEADDLAVWRGVGDFPTGAVTDPRNLAMGWRFYGAALTVDSMEPAEFDALRIENVIPETELLPDETYILEAGFERLNGVDFRKGCYVGQEITARMKHKTELKKGLARVSVTGDSQPVGTAITANDKVVGTLFTNLNGFGIAQLRFDRATGDMQAGTAILRLIKA